MKYNKYKWYSKGKSNKPLSVSVPLLLRIRHGDFSISEYLREATTVKNEYQRIYDKTYNESTTDSVHTKEFDAHQSARMKNVAYLKLMEEGMHDEERILQKFRKALLSEFGHDYWDEATDVSAECKTIEDVYWKYKELCGMGQTPSEIAIALNRQTTKGL